MLEQLGLKQILHGVDSLILPEPIPGRNGNL